MSIHLPIQSHVARPFITKKQWSFSNSVNPGISILLCQDLTGSFTLSNPSSSTGLYNELLYRSVKTLYYDTGSTFYYGFGNLNPDQTFRKLLSQCIVVSVPQEKYGECILRKSFSLEDTDKSRTIKDDGLGNLYDNANSASFSATASAYTIGNIFYEHGVAVITNTGSNYVDFGLGNWVLNYRGKHTVYENEVTMNVPAGEFNYTLNPTIRMDHAGNYLEDVSGYVTGSYWAPYMTTVGLYNSDDELVAVIKFPKPIKNDPHLDLTIVARFDT